MDLITARTARYLEVLFSSRVKKELLLCVFLARFDLFEITRAVSRAAEAYARVGIAVHDAFIGCWYTKYAHNLKRPVTYINENINGQWRSYVITPGFPTYPSGHSVQSGVAAHVLADMFGIKSFRDTTHVNHGLIPAQKPQHFKSFQDAAAEAAVSRLYGGIHYAFDNNDELTSGECIGRTILERVKFRSGPWPWLFQAVVLPGLQ